MSKRRNAPPVSQQRTKPAATPTTRPATATKSTRTPAAKAAQPKLYSAKDMIFGRENYILMAGGLLLVVIGFALMAGGKQSSPDVWEPEKIYSFQRTVLAPIVVLAGLIVEIVAIFRKSPTPPSDTPA